jgi:hypothetical protein
MFPAAFVHPFDYLVVPESGLRSDDDPTVGSVGLKARTGPFAVKEKDG